MLCRWCILDWPSNRYLGSLGETAILGKVPIASMLGNGDFLEQGSPRISAPRLTIHSSTGTRPPRIPQRTPHHNSLVAYRLFLLCSWPLSDRLCVSWWLLWFQQIHAAIHCILRLMYAMERTAMAMIHDEQLRQWWVPLFFRASSGWTQLTSKHTQRGVSLHPRTPKIVRLR